MLHLELQVRDRGGCLSQRLLGSSDIRLLLLEALALVIPRHHCVCAYRFQAFKLLKDALLGLAIHLCASVWALDVSIVLIAAVAAILENISYARGIVIRTADVVVHLPRRNRAATEAFLQSASRHVPTQACRERTLVLAPECTIRTCGCAYLSQCRSLAQWRSYLAHQIHRYNRSSRHSLAILRA